MTRKLQGIKHGFKQVKLSTPKSTMRAFFEGKGCFTAVFYSETAVFNINPCQSDDPVDTKFDGKMYSDIVQQLEKDVLFEVVQQDSHQQRVCAQTLEYVLPIRRTYPVLVGNNDFVISGASALKIPNSELNFSQGSTSQVTV